MLAFQITSELTPENLPRADEISHYLPQYKAAVAIPLLDLGQRQNRGWTSTSGTNDVAKHRCMLPMRVYEVATFYITFSRYVLLFSNLEPNVQHGMSVSPSENISFKSAPQRLPCYGVPRRY